MPESWQRRFLLREMQKVKKYSEDLNEEVKEKNKKLKEIGWKKYLEEK